MTGFSQAVRGWWRRVEPSLTIEPNSTIERLDGAGEGEATAFAFEGFGLTMTLFVGFTPPFRGHRDPYRTRFLRRWYAGEDVTREGGR